MRESRMNHFTQFNIEGWECSGHMVIRVIHANEKISESSAWQGLKKRFGRWRSEERIAGVGKRHLIMVNRLTRQDPNEYYGEIAMCGKRFVNVIRILLFIIIGGVLGGRAYSEDIKIGAVDIQKAINECKEGKEDKMVLTKEVEKFQRLFAERQRELQEMRESLEKQAIMLNPETRAAKENELQTKLRDFQRWGQDTQNEVNQKRMEMERNIATGLKKMIQKVGADEGYTLIVEKNENIVLFASKFIDMTDRVIKDYDAQKK